MITFLWISDNPLPKSDVTPKEKNISYIKVRTTYIYCALECTAINASKKAESDCLCIIINSKNTLPCLCPNSFLRQLYKNSVFRLEFLKKFTSILHNIFKSDSEIEQSQLCIFSQKSFYKQCVLNTQSATFDERRTMAKIFLFLNILEYSKI